MTTQPTALLTGASTGVGALYADCGIAAGA
jgi:hypothetical protein